MNRLKRQALRFLPTLIVAVFALVTIFRHPQLPDIVTAAVFLGLALGFSLVAANREQLVPDKSLVDSEANNRRLRKDLSRLQSRLQESLEAAERNACKESTSVSQLTMATRVPLKSLIGFTNLLANGGDHNDQCLYELRRTCKQLVFLMDVLHGEYSDRVQATQFSLPQMLDDVLACVFPLATARGREIFPLFAESCPGQIRATEPQVKATLFHYLLHQLSNSIMKTPELHLEVNYGHEGDLIFVLTPLEAPAADPDVRFKRLLKECDASLEDGLLAIPVDYATESPIFSGKNLKASVVDNNQTRRQSLISRLHHLGIAVLEPLEHHRADICLAEESCIHQLPTGIPMMILDSEKPVTDNGMVSLRRPIDHAELVSVIENAVSTRPVPRNGKVLAVDDDAANLRLTSLVLDELGFTVYTAVNGREAIQLARQHEFDFIIMDIRMPVLDGLQAAAAIREMKGDRLPIIGLSANVSDQEYASIRSAGMNYVLDKPLTREKFKNWLSRQASPPELATEALPLFDKSQALTLANDSVELANELFRLLTSSLPEDRMKINDAWHRRDPKCMQEAIHKLNGAARYCGIPRLAAAVNQLESLVKSGGSTDVESAMENLNKEIEALLAWHRVNPDPFGPHIKAVDESHFP